MVCRQAQEMKNAMHRPFFANPRFFGSTPKSFFLLVYAKAVANLFETHDPMPSSRVSIVDPRALKFIDDSCEESEFESLDSEESSTTGSPST